MHSWIILVMMKQHLVEYTDYLSINDEQIRCQPNHCLVWLLVAHTGALPCAHPSKTTTQLEHAVLGCKYIQWYMDLDRLSKPTLSLSVNSTTHEMS